MFYTNLKIADKSCRLTQLLQSVLSPFT